jgi:translation initiation factor 1
MPKDWKNRLGVVFSTNPDFRYDTKIIEEREKLPLDEQILKVIIDRKQRKGKAVTLVQGYVGALANLKELGKILKTKCGSGGSVKDGEIIIQGDLCEKVKEILRIEGYKVK